jgi:hypothetical protein
VRSHFTSFPPAPSSLGALNRHVDLLVEVLERTIHGIGRHPEQVLRVVIGNQQLHVSWIFVLARCLELLDLPKDLLIHRGHQDVLRV